MSTSIAFLLLSAFCIVGGVVTGTFGLPWGVAVVAALYILMPYRPPPH